MCFNYTITKFQEYLEKRFKAKFDKMIKFNPKFLIQAFSLPAAPVITALEPEIIQLFTWGLIPFWVKDKIYADKIRTSTFNARNDTIFEKPSFRMPVRKKRCIIPADGFYEWHEYNGRKYPFYIKLASNEMFSFAGIYDEWDSGSGLIKTYSVITTDANQLLAKIHNTKKRMPVILNKNDEAKWLKEMPDDEIKSLMQPCSDDKLTAYTVSKKIIQKKTDTEDPELIKEIKYDELPEF